MLRAAEALAAGEAPAAFCAVRPPGHHATRNRAMGFCLVNNVAVTAAALAEQGERVLIVDYDAHHGNGTQDIFYEHPTVFYVSFHQWPLYPGTGGMAERGEGAGFGCNLNIPLPPRATGEVYLEAIDRIVAPLVGSFEPTWLIISAGFDAHRRDPITDLGLTSGDYALMTAASAGAGARRSLPRWSSRAGTTSRRSPTRRPRRWRRCSASSTSRRSRRAGGPGQRVLDAVAGHWADLLPA